MCVVTPNDLSRLSRQLASELALRGEWSKVAQALYDLASTGIDVPEYAEEQPPPATQNSPAGVGGVDLLRRTMKVMDEYDSPQDSKGA